MKIASKTLKTFCLSGTALGMMLLMSSGAFTPVSAAEEVVASASSVPTTLPSDPPSANEAPPSAVPTSVTLPIANSNSSLRSKANLAPLEEKVNESVKNVVRQLGTIENVNFDDLNTARQAVVKLDVLIDIEKHLAELDKIHSERSGEKNFAAAIPASALGAPSSFSMPMSRAPRPTAAAAPSVSFGHNDVTRITGANGHYDAVIQGKTYRVGDAMPDGTTIVAITAKEVDTKAKNGTVHPMKVKGVDAVYGNVL